MTDPDPHVPETPDSPDVPEGPGITGFDDLREWIVELEQDLSKLKRDHHETVQDLRETIDAQQEEIDEQQSRIEALEQRTDMLRVIEETDDMTAKQRSVTLLQHLRKAAERKGERGRERMASLTKAEAEDALHYPDLERTTFYLDMRRAAKLVSDGDVCYYEGSPSERFDDKEWYRVTSGETLLVLNLEQGSLPAAVVGDTTEGNTG